MSTPSESLWWSSSLWTSLPSSLPLWVFLPSILVGFALTVLAYLIYSGLFSRVEVGAHEPPHGDLVVAYRTGRGQYRGAGQIFTEAFCLLPDRRCLGIYYDDPESVPAEDLRFAVGCILSDGEDASPDHQEMDLMVANGYKIAHLPRPNYAVLASFPFRTTISIYLAISRVYPKLKHYIASRGLCAYPAVEIYEKDSILFMMPLSRQEEWFVPEFSEEEVSIATTEMSTDSRFPQQQQQQQQQRNQRRLSKTKEEGEDVPKESADLLPKNDGKDEKKSSVKPGKTVGSDAADTSADGDADADEEKNGEKNEGDGEGGHEEELSSVTPLNP